MTLAQAHAEIAKIYPESFCIKAELWDHSSIGLRLEFECWLSKESERITAKSLSDLVKEVNKQIVSMAAYSLSEQAVARASEITDEPLTTQNKESVEK